MEKYAVVLEVPQLEDFKKKVASHLENQLGIKTRAGRLPAHITVKSWFGHSSCERIKTLVERIPRKIDLTSMTVNIGPPQFFDQGVVYFPVQGNYFLTQWRRVIDDFESAGIARTGFEGKTPHVTIAKGFSEPEHAALALGEIRAMTKPSLGVIELDNLVLYGREGDDSSTVREMLRVRM